MIRSLRPEDASIFQALRLRALVDDSEAFSSDAEDERAYPLEFVAERLAAPHHRSITLGAFAHGELVGITGVHHQQGRKVQHKAMVWGVFVAPEYRGRGLGGQLVDAAIAAARAMPGVVELQLGVGVTREAARALYRSRGFVVTGIERRALFLGDRYLDEELMALALDATDRA